MTQGPYWDWLYKNGQPPPTPDWGSGAQQFYPPGQLQPGYLPNPLAGDPSGGMAWRNSLRGTPPMPWHYYPLPLQMQGGPTPYQSRPNARNYYDPVGTTQAPINYAPEFARSQPSFESYLAARNNALLPWQTPYAGGSGMQGTVYGNLRGRGPATPTPAPGGGGGKPLYSPAKQDGPTPTPSPTAPFYPDTPTPRASPTPAQWPTPTAWNTPTPFPTATDLPPAGYWNTPSPTPVAPQFQTTFLPQRAPVTNPDSWDSPGGWGGAAQSPAAASSGGFQTPYGVGGGAPAAGSGPWMWSQYDPKNPGAVPQDLWGDQSFLTYADYVNGLTFANSGGGGGGGNTAWQNQFDQEQAAARNAQWAQNFAQQGAQWDQKMAFEQADAARKAEQWQKEQERLQAVDQWTQAFQQAQQDWNKTDAEAKNRLTDQGQNLGAFNRRFGPHVGYM